MMPELSQLNAFYMLTIVGLTFMIYKYKNTLLKQIFKTVNKILDIYLNHKYKNMPTNTPIEDKPYQIVFLKLIQDGFELNLSLSDILKCLKYPTTNLNLKESNEINNDQLIGDLTGSFEAELTYSYNNNYYIYRFKVDRGCHITLPIYQVDDLESCLTIEYESAKTDQSIQIAETILSKIKQYAGPKGNFHDDISNVVRFKPSHIEALKQTTNLTLTDNFGQDYSFE